MSMVELLLQQAVNGLSIGVIYSLIAIGLTLILGILGVINCAQGEFYMLGAFMAFTAQRALGFGYWASILVALVTVAILGILFEYLSLKPLRGRHEFTLLLSTIGGSIFLQNTAQIIWGPDPQSIDSPFAHKPILLGGDINITQQRLLIFVLGLVLIGFIALFIKRTKLGMAMRATAKDIGTASLMGVNVGFIFAFTFAFGTALAAAAGSLLGPVLDIGVTMGEWAVIKAFCVVIMGGMGNVPGAILGGLTLGLAENIGIVFFPTGYQDAVGYTILILVLLFRPRGLFSTGKGLA
ncbi:MAG: branched-chain amino acid ABC transporter permease [Nitrospinota bacterium]